jgi:hypothetical protein
MLDLWGETGDFQPAEPRAFFQAVRRLDKGGAHQP